MSETTERWNIFKNFKFPIACWIILIHEVLERFSFYGMKGILTIYLNLYIGFDEDTTTILYHLFSGLSYLSPIFGAIIADNYLGRFKTVIVVGMIYLLGHILMPLTAIRKNVPGPLVGMTVLAIGAGGIKSSVAAFGGDQIPTGNDKMIEKYFSLFYTAINLGAFVAQFVTPILRKDVSCVDNQCYPLGFGVPAAAFFVTYIIFIAGKKTYTIVPRSRSVLSKFVHCIYLGISKYFKKGNVQKYKTFIDYAQPEYSQSFIQDCKTALRIMILFTPIPVFWALYDQQGSRWTLQAKYMNGKIGNNYFMKPEQIQAFNALFIIALIPVFDFIVYPLFEKLGFLVKPTSRLVASYVVAAVSFILAGLLQIYVIKGQNLSFAANESRLVVTNAIFGAKINVTVGNKYMFLNSEDQFTLNVLPQDHILRTMSQGFESQWKNVTLNQHQLKSAIIYKRNDTGRLDIKFNDVIKPDGKIHIKFIDLYDTFGYPSLMLTMEQKNVSISNEYVKIDTGIYKVLYGNYSTIKEKSKRFELYPGLVGTIIRDYQNNLYLFKEFEPDLIHMLWQLPQYIIITCAEILCSITALSFAYSESPDSMKSLMQAVYLITIFGGNIIVAIVAGVGSHITQTTEFFLFAGLVLLAGLINWILIKRFWNSNADEQENGQMSEMSK